MNPDPNGHFNGYVRLNSDHFLLDRKNPSFYVNDHLTIVSGSDLSGTFSTMAGMTHTGFHFRSEQIRSTSLGEPFDPGETITFRDSITFTHGHVRNQFNWNLNHSYELGQISLSGGLMVHLNSDLDYRPAIFPGVDFRWSLPAFFNIYAPSTNPCACPLLLIFTTRALPMWEIRH